MANINKTHTEILLGGSNTTVICDGQYGSTGKGLLAAALAEASLFHNIEPFEVVTTNAGPNSGHTFYAGEEKVVLKQLPSYPVALALKGDGTQHNPVVYINSGAIIEPKNLIEEAQIAKDLLIMVSNDAAVVLEDNVSQEQQLTQDIGSTGKGTGASLASKVMRQKNSTIGEVRCHYQWPSNIVFINQGDMDDLNRAKTLVEISQGFSLSINAGGFWPFCTSRDCTVMQGLSDARLHPHSYDRSIMAVRTFPIRVGGNSGPCYPDQLEVSWNVVGVEPELTTVTKKQRRIFTWSAQQFQDAVEVNRPDGIFVNFMNYLPKNVHHEQWLEFNISRPYTKIMGHVPVILLGYGPKCHEVRSY